MDSKNDRKKSIDYDFKTVVSEADILAEILSAAIPDFEGMPREEIKKWMDLDDKGRHAKVRETEVRAAGGGTFRLDSYFELRDPNAKDGQVRGVVINIEGQGKQYLTYPLKNR